ncbi:MAG: MarR family winged helix-turn-helix transcriptional regulator [Gemmatimonadaceae bacterium]
MVTSPRLQEELRQTKPFQSLEQEALLSIERTAAILSHGVADALRRYEITPTQYNVLRILRGAGERGLCRNEVRDRLVSQVPDVTRLLDRMEQMQLIERERDTDDRRMVLTRLTRKGSQLLARIDEPVARLHERQLGHLSAARLRTLIDLLAEVRRGDPGGDRPAPPTR